MRARALLLLLSLAPRADALSMPSRRTTSRRQACHAAAALGSTALLGPLASFADEPKMPPISASKMLSIGQYLSDVKESRLFLKSTIEEMATSDCYQVRRELRKPPLRESASAGVRAFAIARPLTLRVHNTRDHAHHRAQMPDCTRTRVHDAAHARQLRLRPELTHGLRAMASAVRKATSKVVGQLDDGSSLKKTKEKQYEDIKLSLAALDDACRDGVDRSKLDMPRIVTTFEDRLAAFESGFGFQTEL